MSSAPSMTLGDWGWLLLLSFIWGATFFFSEIALQELPPFTIVFIRVSGGAVMLWLIILALGYKIPRDPKLWLAFVIMGIFNNAIPFTLLVSGQQTISSGMASILNAMTPAFTVILAHFLTVDEKMRGHRLLGVGLGIAGVVVLIGPSAWQGQSGSLWGQMLCLGAALSYGVAVLFGRRFRNQPLLVVATGQVTCSSVIMMALAIGIDRPWLLAMPSWTVMAALIALAFLGTALAYMMFFHILARAGATNASLVTLLIPASAVLLGVLFLKEDFLLNQLVGMVLIGLGLLSIDGRLIKMR